MASNSNAPLVQDESKLCPNCKERPPRKGSGWCKECTTKAYTDKRNEMTQAMKLLESLIQVIEQDVRPRTPMEIAQWVYDQVTVDA